MDKYRRGLDEYRMVGTIVRRAGAQCWIVWDNDDDVSTYAEADVRYWVDSGRARIQQPVKRTLITEMLEQKKGDPTS